MNTNVVIASVVATVAVAGAAYSFYKKMVQPILEEGEKRVQAIRANADAKVSAIQAETAEIVKNGIAQNHADLIRMIEKIEGYYEGMYMPEEVVLHLNAARVQAELFKITGSNEAWDKGLEHYRHAGDVSAELISAKMMQEVRSKLNKASGTKIRMPANMDILIAQARAEKGGQV